MTIDFKEKIYILDGAMGTMLQRAGMKSGDNQNEYLLAHPEVVEDIQRQYVEAGADFIYAPTFTLNHHVVQELGGKLDEIVAAFAAPAFKVRAEAAQAGKKIRVGLDMGPLGEMLEPMGSLTFEEAYETYSKVVRAGVKAGVDMIAIETMTDLYEVKAAVLASKENCDLPVFVTMTFDEGGRTFTGTSLEAMAVMLNGLGVDAMGINCSLGPAQILPMIQELRSYTELPIIAKPNAGLPDPATGAYDITCDQFVETMKDFMKAGVNMIGGCCGTDPSYIKGLAENAKAFGAPAGVHTPQSGLKVSSRSKVVTIDHVTVIGERLNPTGKKRMKQALLEGNLDYVLAQAIEQEEAGAEILDVNVGVPGLDDVAMMPKVVKQIQSITNLPLQIDSSNPAAIEAALRVYNGKAIVNSVNGEEKSMNQILPIVKKYGAAVIALTLDDKGIPKTAEERFAIAERILAKALEYGIPREDVIVDCLTLTVSAQQKEVNETLRAVRMVTDTLQLPTALGVSNVSFGLPVRPLINRTFLTLAMENGLTLPIINPNDEDMMAQIFAFNVLKNRDVQAEAYIERYSDASRLPAGLAAKKPAPAKDSTSAGSAEIAATGETPADSEHAIFRAIEKGMDGDAVKAVKELLQTCSEMEVVNTYMIPALDRVGQKFEKGTLFLPQMLQAAQAAQAGFDIIKERLAKNNGESVSIGDVVIATVHGDIHDIGKNIVKVIMDNYGFHMIDLGKNVPAEEIVRTVKEQNIKLVGLSALMTTTLKSMEETIAAIKDAAPDCKVMVGGAVLTEDYAKAIGADYYCKDAMKSVEAGQEVFR